MKTVNRVLVIDKHGKPLMPCHPARARQLLRKGRAVIYRRYPFTILIKDREVRNDGKDVQPVRLKIDPGSKVTGLSLVGEFQRGKTVIWAAELHHRGQQIRNALAERRVLRRSRRYRKTRYRAPRFLNRRRPEGWLPPSIMSRVCNVRTWVYRLQKFAPVTSLSMELAKFDTQKLMNPEIQGIEYQQGTLFGYEVREYLLEKFGRRCVYCDKENVPLEIDHVIPRSKGGSDRVSNLVIACHDCNQAKGSRPLEEFLAHEPERAKRIKAELETPLKDAAAVNATRWTLFHLLKETGLELEVGTGGRTKRNRSVQEYPKAHWIDASCVGESGEYVRLVPDMQVLKIFAKGHGRRRMCTVDKYGFPRSHRLRMQSYLGFKTGDIVRAVIPKGKYEGVHVGRITIRHRPSFRLNGFDVHPKYLNLLHKNDGYEYALKTAHSPSQ